MWPFVLAAGSCWEVPEGGDLTPSKQPKSPAVLNP